jgi:ATP-dependent RNA helicase DDX6/DHH1
MDNQKQKNENKPTLAAPQGLDISKVTKAPLADTRIRTEDVTATKGLSFADFGLSQDLQLGIYEKGYEKPSPI